MDLTTHQHSILEQARRVDVEGQGHEILVQRDTLWCICHAGQRTFDEDGIRGRSVPAAQKVNQHGVFVADGD